MPSSQWKDLLLRFPQGLSSGHFPILVLFPTWYLAFLCAASSSAGDEGQPRQRELRETEQKHLRVRVWHKGTFSTNIQLKAAQEMHIVLVLRAMGHPTAARRGLWTG